MSKAAKDKKTVTRGAKKAKLAKVEKNKGGRPTDYKEEYNEQARKLALLGLNDSQMAIFFNVAISTFHLWKINFTKFSDALNAGKVVADADVAASLYKRAVGYEVEEKSLEKTTLGTKTKITKKEVPADVGAATLWLKNRQKALWRDKVDMDLSSTDGTMTPTVIERVVVYGEIKKEVKDNGN